MKNLILLLSFLIYASCFSQQEEPAPAKNLSPFWMPVDISLTPTVGLGYSLAGGRPLVRNVSINLLVGSANKLQGIELGVIANTELNNSFGIQVSGMANSCLRQYTGVQTSGLINLCIDYLFGIQTAGLANLAACGAGIQIAGIINFGGNKNFRYYESDNQGPSTETPLSPFEKNVLDRGFAGLQLSGLLNVIEGELNGLQISGLINYARIVQNGIQIAPVNISKENNGYFLGLVNFIGKRKLSYDLWGEETGFVNAGLRSGTEKFHNVAFVGVQAKSKTAYTYGLLFGWRLLNNKNFYFDADFSSQNIQTKFGRWNNYLNILSKIRLMAGYKISHHLSVFGGPVFNAFVSSETDGSNLVGYSLYEKNSTCDCGNIIRQKYWIGINLGLSY